MQNPLKIDQLLLNPGNPGDKRISTDTLGNVLFSDQFNSNLTLTQLANLGTVSSVYLVGSGSGVGYGTISDAISAAVSAGVSVINPCTIFVFPGVYDETLTITASGLNIIGYPGAILKNTTTNDHTLKIQSGSTTPTKLSISGLKIENPNTGKDCVRVVGSSGSTIGSYGVYFINCSFKALTGCNALYAICADNLFVSNCDFSESQDLATISVINCSYFILDSAVKVPLLTLSYTTGDVPSVLTSTYELHNCFGIGRGQTSPIPVTLLFDRSGVGSLSFYNSSMSSISLSGDKTVSCVGSDLGAITISSTSTLRFVGSSYSSLASVGASSSIVESVLNGQSTLVTDQTTITVTLPYLQKDTNYMVVVSLPFNSTYWITSKTTSQFVLNVGASQLADIAVPWTILRSEV